MTKEIAEKYFPIYDTFEIIEPAHIKDLSLEYIRDDPVALLLKVRNIADSIKGELEIITHNSVEFALLTNGYPKSLERYVYLYLKNKK